MTQKDLYHGKSNMVALNQTTMRIAITGAAGLIGKALTKHFTPENQVLALTRNDLDITNHLSVRKLILSERPDLIINCAVLGVDACEDDPTLAMATNVKGPEALARAAAEIDSQIIHFSTNYVFDGRIEKDSLYSIDNGANPISVYGKTKLAGELAVLSNSPRSYVVRTSWVFGPDKSNFFSDVPKNLKLGKPFRAVTDVLANTTYVSDLASRVEQIIKRQCYGTYHVVNSGVCSYYDYALEAARILKLSTAEMERLIQPFSSDMMHWHAVRPRYSPMSCFLSERLGFAALRDWREALAEFIRISTVDAQSM
jgi:dTDP-4-dehydrorhamnose reductase